MRLTDSAIGRLTSTWFFVEQKRVKAYAAWMNAKYDHPCKGDACVPFRFAASPEEYCEECAKVDPIWREYRIAKTLEQQARHNLTRRIKRMLESVTKC